MSSNTELTTPMDTSASSPSRTPARRATVTGQRPSDTLSRIPPTTPGTSDVTRRASAREPPLRRLSQREAPPPVQPPDVISFFDPASVGGGGPLRRISTQQKERAEAEARERAAREAAGIPEGGILNRFRSSSMNRPKPTFITPLAEEKHTTNKYAPSLSPTWSSKTLAGMEGEDDPQHLNRDAEKGRDVSAAPSEGITEEHHEEVEEHHYPDGGYGWVVLCCCITLAGLTMGWGMTWGVFQAYYAQNVWPDASSVYLSAAGTTNPLFMTATSFFAGKMGDRFGFKRMLYASACLCWIGVFCAGWGTEVWHIMLTQGIISGIGQGLALPLFMSLPSQWFYRKRGFASGAAMGGAGLGGGFATLIVRSLLVHMGYKHTLIIISFINLTIALIATFLIRTRPSSPEAQGGGGPWIDKEVCSTGRFWAITCSLLFAVLGYAIPWTWLPQWVTYTLPDLDPTLQVIPQTLMAFCVCIGRALAGATADKIGPLNTYLGVFFLSGVIPLALWLTASSFAHISVFAVIFGIISPGFMGLIPQIVVQIFGANNLASNVGLLLIANAPGNFVSGPLGGALYDMTGRTSFKWLIITGACASFVGCVFAVYDQSLIPYGFGSYAARFVTERRIWSKV